MTTLVRRLRRRLRNAGLSAPALTVLFIVVHVWLWLLNLAGPNNPIGDVPWVYLPWASDAAAGTVRIGIDEPWVYPILAFVPMAISLLFGPSAYVVMWLTLVTALDAVLIVVLFHVVSNRRVAFAAARWWLLFLLLLGPVSVARIDAVTVPLATIGLLLVSGRPRVAGLLLTAAMWMKVWPVAVLSAAVIVARRRLAIVVTTLLASGGIVVGSLAAGGTLATVFGFVAGQSGRGIQVESPVATVWLWLVSWGAPGVSTAHNDAILTFQIKAPGTEAVSSVMDPLMLCAVVAIAVLGIVAVRAHARADRLLPVLALAFVSCLMVFNKVGSPQFLTWLAAPIVAGLLVDARRWRVPAAMGLMAAALTQIVYPYNYGALLAGEPWIVAAITVRNFIELALLLWAASTVFRLSFRMPGRSRTVHTLTTSS